MATTAFTVYPLSLAFTFSFPHAPAPQKPTWEMVPFHISFPHAPAPQKPTWEMVPFHFLISFPHAQAPQKPTRDGPHSLSFPQAPAPQKPAWEMVPFSVHTCALQRVCLCSSACMPVLCTSLVRQLHCSQGLLIYWVCDCLLHSFCTPTAPAVS